MNYLDLRKKYPVFEYKSFSWKENGADLDMEWEMICGELKFNPKVKILNTKTKEDIENFVFHLGLAEIFTYWKATCSPTIRISCGTLDKEQTTWWHDLLIRGMGQYFFENKINFKENEFITILSSGKIFPKTSAKSKSGLLIPVGGGKDSAVTLELLKNKRDRVSGVILENIRSVPAAERLTLAAGLKSTIKISRTIDPLLLELNEQGYLNGHTPISAYMAFLFTFVAYLKDYDEIAVSNERSSNEGNLNYLGEVINHQYSKSFEFEKKFLKYNGKYLSGINYYSFLRPLYELQIIKLFSKMERYFPIFRSCNVGQKTDSWCVKCPKCMSVYLGLRAFLPKDKVDKIFGREVIVEEKLILSKNKPFECIGTYKETQVAFYLSGLHAKYPGSEGVLKGWTNDNFLPGDLKSTLKFTYFANILILGYAREGRSVREFLLKNYPDSKITIWDQKVVDGAEKVGDWKEVKNWTDFDLIVKSAGIPLKNLPKKIYPKLTSETQIFFDSCPGEIVGITGTKGKSTTTALIYEVLKAAGKKTVMVGNIGKPALDYLEGIDEETIVVFELSSHQLQTLTKSPHIAVLTNIYPEHLDYYLDFKDYVKAKLNITKFQKKGDFLVYNQENPIKSKASKIPFGKEVTAQSKLLGEHNQYNISAAKKVIDIYGINDEIFNKTVANFKSLEHRMEFVGKFRDIKFYNDSLATIPEATISAIEALGDDLNTIILGGMDRGVDYLPIAKKILVSKIKNLILFPTTGEKIWQLMCELDKSAPGKFMVVKTDRMEEAVRGAYNLTTPGKSVILSCASTSFNLFTDYADRGKQFKDWAVKLGKTA